jgi:RsiW-degrading membrane proteinase PrsW (M82 family)
MSIPIACSCGKRLKVRDEFAGKRVKCPGCGQPLAVPAPTSEEDYEVVDSEAPPTEPTSDDPPPPSEPAVSGWGSMEETPAASGWGGMEETSSTPREEGPPRPPKLRKRKKKLERTATDVSTPREYLYWLLPLALIPLFIHVFTEDRQDVERRVEETLRKLATESPEVQARVDRIMAEEETILTRRFLDALPDARIEGALLAHGSRVHWLYALLSAVLFLGLALFLFSPGHAHPLELLPIALFTGTVGVVLLFAVQLCALLTHGVVLHGRGFLVPFFYILKFIGFSYHAADDPENGFFLSFVGYTFGVGLCEEVSKAIPLLWHFRRRPFLGWRGACLWGLASGVGFGVAEGIAYSSDFYNGVAIGSIYVVRFVSCVALHGMWSAAVGISIFEWSAWFRSETDLRSIAAATSDASSIVAASFLGQLSLGEYLLLLLRVLWVPILLHGLYDTFLKKDMDMAALAVAAASFAWLVWKIEQARAVHDESPKVRAA